MNQLNPAQKEAVTYLNGPLLVVAGAGSGKTGVITQKIAYLIQQAQYKANQVFAVTFTNKAAKEMSERARKLLGKQARGLNVSTFHRLGLNMLHQEYSACGLRPNFSIFDSRDSINLLKSITKSEDDAHTRNIQQIISAYKNANLTPSNARSLASDEHQQLAAIAYEQYQAQLSAYNAVDFDDLLLKPLQLLTERDDIRTKWQQRVRYLLIDEYQDTNSCQYNLIRLLTGAGEAFTAVGDDDQSIYAWRGAQPENIRHLHEDYPRLKTITLEQNYRCDRRILNAANELIANNPHLVEKRLWSHIDDGDGVFVVSARNEADEAERVVADIFTTKIQQNRPAGDFAILYRSNFQARILEEQLRTANLPYHLSGGTSFFDHSEIRDLISYLRLINNPEDDAAFLRICNVPKRGIGTTSISKLGEYAAQRQRPLLYAATEIGLRDSIGSKSYAQLQQFTQWILTMQQLSEAELPVALLEQIISDIDYDDHLFQLHKQPVKIEKRQQRLGQLKSWFGKLQADVRYQTLSGLMQHLQLLDILDKQETKQDGVELMTLHAAKGLEFPYVYIVGVEEQLLPHQNSSDTTDAIAEERRLLYVGMTRAKKRVTLSYAKKRKRGGDWQATEPSRFLEELPEDGVNWQDGRQPVDPQQAQENRESFFASLYDMFDK